LEFGWLSHKGASMSLERFDVKKLEAIAKLMASSSSWEVEAWPEIVSIAGEQSLARRATEWLPEAFGYVLLSHIPEVQLPKSFHVKSADGSWHEFKFAVEPIAADAISLAMQIFHSGERELFEKLALRSALVTTVNSSLNSNADLVDAKLTGPAFLTLPAELYL
jgi:hypothetical protein